MKKLSKKLIARRLARKVQKLLRHKQITIVAVTGSVGKTMTKVAIGKVLGQSYQVRYTEDSYNTDIGLPLSIFGLKAPSQLWDALAWQRIFQKINVRIKNYPDDVVVLEMADDELDDMMEFLSFIKPQYSVVTAVAPVHMERLETMEKVVHDNWQIAKAAKQVFYNADQPELRKLGSKPTKAQGFGLSQGKVRFSNVTRNSKGFLSVNMTLDKQEYKFTTQMIAPQSLYSLLAAASVANAMGIEPKAIVQKLKSITSINGRMNLLPGLEGSRLIDDSYNSSPDAVKAALKVLAEFKGRKIAVLGNMNELGSHAQNAHYETGQAASKVADLLVVIGKDAETHTVSGATDAGMAQDNIKVFKTPYEAGHFLKQQLTKNDVVLIKGSQNGVFSEEVTRILLDPSLDPAQELVRQSSVWKRRKRKAFGL